VSGVQVKLNITHPNDPDLKVTLIGPMERTRVTLFNAVVASGTHANFSNTVF